MWKGVLWLGQGRNAKGARCCLLSGGTRVEASFSLFLGAVTQKVSELGRGGEEATTRSCWLENGGVWLLRSWPSLLSCAFSYTWNREAYRFRVSLGGWGGTEADSLCHRPCLGSWEARRREVLENHQVANDGLKRACR